jgi:thiosulfate reductase cytochrome b subunit
MAWHFAFMWLFAINGVLYVSFTLLSGEWRYLIPNRSRAKFNHAQQFAYTGIIVMGVGSVVTGLAIYKPTQISGLTWLLGGYQVARFEHFCLTLGYVVFFLIHILQVFRAGWNTLRSMITGYEIVENGKVSNE